MAGRKRSHSEARWALLPPTVIRCNATRPNGSRCKREAENGGVVCDQHGAAAPQVRETEIVEVEGEPANDTPPRVAEMIKAGAFDRKPGSDNVEASAPADEHHQIILSALEALRVNPGRQRPRALQRGELLSGLAGGSHHDRRVATRSRSSRRCRTS
jgi:hypothetical protein